MSASVFGDKKVQPAEADLKAALGDRFPIWNGIPAIVERLAGEAVCEWKYYSSKSGWSTIVRVKNRTIVHLSPLPDVVAAGFLFGENATNAALNSDIPESVKNDLRAVPYLEGRGIRFRVGTEADLATVEKLVRIKLDN
jgi:hypothetical protein